MERGGASYYYLADGAGNVTSLTNASGAVVESYTLDSFGNVVSSTGTLTNPYVFASRTLDPETGLYYFRARYDDPATGRFLTPFSPATLMATILAGGTRRAGRILGANLHSPQGLNAYSYAINNPVNQTDPYGLDILVVPAPVITQAQAPQALNALTGNNLSSNTPIQCNAAATHELDAMVHTMAQDVQPPTLFSQAALVLIAQPTTPGPFDPNAMGAAGPLAVSAMYAPPPAPMGGISGGVEAPDGQVGGMSLGDTADGAQLLEELELEVEATLLKLQIDINQSIIQDMETTNRDFRSFREVRDKYQQFREHVACKQFIRCC
jgi:RHS repeat-associated protein